MMNLCLNDCSIKKTAVGKWYVIFPSKQCNMTDFVLELTESSTMEEAHDKMEKILGHDVRRGYISPPLVKSDIEKLIEYFFRIEPLFD